MNCIAGHFDVYYAMHIAYTGYSSWEFWFDEDSFATNPIWFGI